MNEYAICCSRCGVVLFYSVTDAVEGSLVIDIRCEGNGVHYLIPPSRPSAVAIMRFLGELPRKEGE